MRNVDVAIVGGGLAGSTAAAMLGRAGISAVLIDPHTVYPPDFRCEKMDASQVELLKKTGLADAIFAAATPDDQLSIARLGRLVETRPGRQYGILYDALVNTMRGQISPQIDFLVAKATSIAPNGSRQRVTLSSGDPVDARLVVVSNGLNAGLRHQLGIKHEVVSACHSISIGFDVKTADNSPFRFKALTYFPERPSNRMAYCAFFPTAKGMRANLFVYREIDDPWLRQMRQSPESTLFTAFPGLLKLSGPLSIGDVKIRPVDLYVSRGHRQGGVVLIGDAFATSCPAAGTGTNKVFTDVERLCNVYIPRWLATDGMGSEKISAFYDDPVKLACDTASRKQAFYLRALSTQVGPLWHLRRWARFLVRLGSGTARRLLMKSAGRDAIVAMPRS